MPVPSYSSEVVMRLGKALATGVAEEQPDVSVRDEDAGRAKAVLASEEIPAEVPVEVTAGR
ncbi:hypothetical protein [Streptomyces sp. CBMA152]|uniref:hypothetical protein n=1 Tax=Streptomyces sp. CBMA152 TaxID=1896312 RepID=UPI0016600C4C|nr:hypothetical protein [Streptomyces sp. CBMA152]